MDGHTPLLLAALWGAEQCIEILLEANADITATCNEGKNVLHFLVEHGRRLTNQLHKICQVRFYLTSFIDCLKVLQTIITGGGWPEAAKSA